MEGFEAAVAAMLQATSAAAHRRASDYLVAFRRDAETAWAVCVAVVVSRVESSGRMGDPSSGRMASSDGMASGGRVEPSGAESSVLLFATQTLVQLARGGRPSRSATWRSDMATCLRLALRSASVHTVALQLTLAAAALLVRHARPEAMKEELECAMGGVATLPEAERELNPPSPGKSDGAMERDGERERARASQGTHHHHWHSDTDTPHHHTPRHTYTPSETHLHTIRDTPSHHPHTITPSHHIITPPDTPTHHQRHTITSSHH
jgi:hypothetical protein